MSKQKLTLLNRTASVGNVVIDKSHQLMQQTGIKYTK